MAGKMAGQTAREPRSHHLHRSLRSCRPLRGASSSRARTVGRHLPLAPRPRQGVVRVPRAPCRLRGADVPRSPNLHILPRRPEPGRAGSLLGAHVRGRPALVRRSGDGRLRAWRQLRAPLGRSKRQPSSSASWLWWPSWSGTCAAGRWSPIAGMSSDVSVAPLAVIGLKGALATYGSLAVFAFVEIVSLGIPFPGETMLFSAAIYSGTSGNLSIAFVVAAAATGAIVGDNIGFGIGHLADLRFREHGPCHDAQEPRQSGPSASISLSELPRPLLVRVSERPGDRGRGFL